MSYQIVNGTSYHIETSKQVIDVLESARLNKTRIRVYYGDVATGKCWHEEHYVTGYVGRSTGISKIPLLIYNKNSIGGCGVLDSCIIKIRKASGGQILFQADNFQHSTFKITPSNVDGYTHEVFIDGELYSRHTSLMAATKLINKMS